MFTYVNYNNFLWYILDTLSNKDLVTINMVLQYSNFSWQLYKVLFCSYRLWIFQELY